MPSELSSLANLIFAEVQALETAHDGVVLPPLDEDYVPSIYSDPRFMHSAGIILSAASRLIAAIQNPYLAVQQASGGMHISTLLNVAVEANLTEALKEAGSEGLHVNELAPRVNMDPIKLERTLRYLCAHHIYREVSPSVFANNRLSMALDTGKPFEAVKDRGLHRYDNATGVAPFVGHTTDEVFRSASVLSPFLLDPSDSTTSRAPLLQAFNQDSGDFFHFLEQPGNEKRLYRFGAAMKNMEKLLPHDLVLAGFDWYSLPRGSLVVDVGAGIGAVTLSLARNLPQLGFVVQDRPSVIADAEQFWKKEMPEALESGLVQLQGHDFFQPQPTKGVGVFMLRHVLHDWSDAQAKVILDHLRAAATPSTKLVILDQIVPYTCPVDDAPPLPHVLKGNPGPLTGLAFMLDIQMMNACNSRERTKGEWESLVKKSGWEIESVWRGPMNSIVCKIHQEV